ncbi:diflavin flavoprotein [Synechococcus sp. PCC 7336]|uniref:diflavin flavoprotein n=1 Tax=Synechococcus sp. PCC 7336 TaxID=195250 RepID=UPI0003499C74
MIASLPKQQRDVQKLFLLKNTFALRSRTWERLKFEIEYALQKGTTANSFLIQADRTALIDPPGESFSEIFLETLEQLVELKAIDLVVLGHINPNRVKTLIQLLERAPQIEVLCSTPAAKQLPQLFEKEEFTAEVNIRAVKRGDILDLGQGHRLEFCPIPTPKWPDGMATYDPATQILFTDKLFGAHVCGDQVWDEGWKVYESDRRYYYDSLMATQARQVDAALDRFESFEIKGYAPGHGPLVRYGLTPLTQSYREWNRVQSTQMLSAAVIYASAYGNTATMAQAIGRGIAKAGVTVESINCEFASTEEIKSVLEKTSGFIFGSPTLGGHAPTPVQTALGTALSIASKEQLVGVFGSYGWSGEAVDIIANKLRDAGYLFGFEPLSVKFTPDAAMLQKCEELGTDFGQALKKGLKQKTKAARQPATNVEQAVGRIIGSLCVVTAKRESASSAMLASWVSQATFDPPGLTVAVAKDRAIESLLFPGDTFVLNILAEGKYIPLMKHFLKPFGPGEDRFEGVESAEAEDGTPILSDGLAYLECRVEQRMECGDHWVVYSVVEAGDLLDADGKAALHYRQTGTHY